MDVGDRSSRYCILNEAGETASEEQLPSTKAGLDGLFAKMAPCRIALEVGTHSPWVSRHLASLGHDTIVANSREIAYITRSTRKNDRLDAEKLARLARVDVKLLLPIRHRSEAAQADLAILRARDKAVRERSSLMGAVRGMVKSTRCACHSLHPHGKAGRPPVKAARRLAPARCAHCPLGLDGASSALRTRS